MTEQVDGPITYMHSASERFVFVRIPSEAREGSLNSDARAFVLPSFRCGQLRL